MSADPIGAAETLAKSGRRAEAADAALRALAGAQGDAAALERLGRVLGSAGRNDEAATLLEESLLLRPLHGPTLVTLGLVRRDLGAWEDAAEILTRACTLDANDAFARYSLGGVLLALGRYEEGLPALLAGRHSVVRESRFPGPGWRGEGLRDADDGSPGTLLLYSDGGLGDAIMYARYVPVCAARARVAMTAPPSLGRLFATLPGLAEFCAAPRVPRYHAQLPLEHLPLLWGTTPRTVPDTIPYLSADPALAAGFAARLAALPRPRIGLAWAGNPAYRDDVNRSVPLATLAPLLAVPGVSFVSLQVGAAAAQAREVAGLTDWTAEFADLADTAALIAGLDLVISVDTAVVHLAGALGKPVWLLNRRNTDWRWGLGRDDCAWYPTLRQFRQLRLGAWDAPVREAAAALAGLSRSGLLK
jgi:hypothetical protein